MFKINSIHLGVCMLDIETEFQYDSRMPIDFKVI